MYWAYWFRTKQHHFLLYCRIFFFFPSFFAWLIRSTQQFMLATHIAVALSSVCNFSFNTLNTCNYSFNIVEIFLSPDGTKWCSNPDMLTAASYLRCQFMQWHKYSIAWANSIFVFFSSTEWEIADERKKIWWRQTYTTLNVTVENEHEKDRRLAKKACILTTHKTDTFDRKVKQINAIRNGKRTKTPYNLRNDRLWIGRSWICTFVVRPASFLFSFFFCFAFLCVFVLLFVSCILRDMKVFSMLHVRVYFRICQNKIFTKTIREMRCRVFR